MEEISEEEKKKLLLPLAETYSSRSSPIYPSSTSSPPARSPNPGIAPSSSPSAVSKPSRGCSSTISGVLRRTPWLRPPWPMIQFPMTGSSSKPQLPSNTSPPFDPLTPRCSTRYRRRHYAFHLIWRHVVPPRVWRVDPIVAVVGRSLIAAGGVNEFEDDRLAVELFDIETGGEWERCESMPEFLWGSASSTWISVAVSSEKLYVTEKRSGMACCFDPETRSWTEIPDLCPGDDEDDCKLYSRVIGFAGNRLIMAGIIGDEDNPTGIELWEVESNESKMKSKFESIGSMPMECLDKLRGIGSDWPLTSIAFNAVGDMVYVYDATVAGEIVAAEMEGGKLCKWRTLRNGDAKWNQSHGVERVTVACSVVGFSDLKRAFRDNLSFST